jgi:hypothetical protein
LLVAKLDRLARNVAFISALMEAGVEFVAADLPQANKLTVHIMAAMAEYEAAAISARTKAALAAAKARGAKLGGYRWRIQTVGGKANAESAKVRTATARKRASDLFPVSSAFDDATFAGPDLRGPHLQSARHYPELLPGFRNTASQGTYLYRNEWEKQYASGLRPAGAGLIRNAPPDLNRSAS